MPSESIYIINFFFASDYYEQTKFDTDDVRAYCSCYIRTCSELASECIILCARKGLSVDNSACSCERSSE